MLSNLMIKLFLKIVTIILLCLAAAFHVFADISLAENVFHELPLPQTKIADVTFNNVLSIQSQVNFSSNSAILQKIGEFAYCYKISLITSSLLISTLTLTTIAISNMFSDPIILTLPELTQELVLLPKIPIPISQPDLFSVQATFFNANSLIDPNNVITPYLADLLARDPRIGVNLTDLNTMPQVLQLFSVINWPVVDPLFDDPFVIRSFRDIQGINYDAFVGVNPAFADCTASPIVTQFWVHQLTEQLSDLPAERFIMYQGEIAIIPYDSLNYTRYHQIDVSCLTFNEWGQPLLDPTRTYFVKDFMPNTQEGLKAAAQFLKEIETTTK